MKIIIKKSEKSLIDEFIARLKKEILRKKKKKKRFSLVLTGGSSPVKLYKKLALSNIDWSSVDLFWGDERYVSHKSKNSNFKLGFDTFIKKIKINKKNIFSINTNKHIEICSNEYSNKIKNYFKNKKISFDYFLLGMGVDGHIASIFPKDNNLFKTFISKPVYRKDFKRITLSLKVINDSKNIILWLNKKSKLTKYDTLKKLGKKIPVNNLNRSNTIYYKVK